MEFDYPAGVARVNGAALAALANAPAAPTGAQIIATELTNKTTLTWQPNTEPDLAGYEVVWRDTTAPLWQHTKFVGDVTQVTLDMSKDNVFFGVRAVDDSGNASPVAFPSPRF